MGNYNNGRPNNNNQRNNNNNRRRQQPRYQNPDPMFNVRDMGRYGIRLIREIAKGKFNFYNEGHVFRNIDFVRATLEEVKKKLYEANIHVAAMEFTYANSSDPIVQDLMIRDKKTVEAYNKVYEVLMMVINSGGDSRYIQILITNLPKYKYNM